MSNVVYTSDKPVINITKDAKVLLVEPFYGGSHKILIDILYKYTSECSLITLPAKKWHWRARCGAICIANYIPKITLEKVLFCSSVLNLTELLGLRPDLNCLKKVIYFHENQLIYPVQQIKQRDVQYSYNQIISCLSADVVIFNSYYNQHSFLDNIKTVIKMLPDFRPKNIRDEIETKCMVIYFPLEFPKLMPSSRKGDILHIVWPHRWEFDKGPEEFFSVLIRLKATGVPFGLSILGEIFKDVPDVFEASKAILSDKIKHFGYVESKDDYYSILRTCHVVVSTAKHEFFGVSVLEATYSGCFPLVPDSLVYPEIYPTECLYKSVEELHAKLYSFALQPELATEERGKLSMDFSKYSCDELISKYRNILNFVDN